MHRKREQAHDPGRGGWRGKLTKAEPEDIDPVVFERFIFIGTVLLHRTEQDTLLMPLGHFLDQWKLYREYNGLTRPKPATGRKQATIDDAIPPGLL